MEEIGQKSQDITQRSIESERELTVLISEVQDHLNALEEQRRTIEATSFADPVKLANQAIQENTAKIVSIEEYNSEFAEWNEYVDHVLDLVHAHPLFVTNKCDRPIKVAIEWTGPFRQIYEGAWWNIAPGSRFNPNMTGRGRIVVTDPKVFVYAESTDSMPKIYWRGEKGVEIADEVLLMLEMTADSEDDRYEISLSCGGS